MDRKQFYGKLYYSTATKNKKQIMMMIIKLKIVIMIIIMMTNLYFSADDVVAWTNQVLKLPPLLVASLFLCFFLCLCLLCTIMNTRENIKKVKIWSKKRIS